MNFYRNVLRETLAISILTLFLPFQGSAIENAVRDLQETVDRAKASSSLTNPAVTADLESDALRLHHARNADLRRGLRLGKQDRLALWSEPKNWERRYLPVSLWKRLEPELWVRVLRVSLRCPGFRTRSVTMVTTLLDPQAYPPSK